MSTDREMALPCPRSVLFVCMGNTCRSQMAEAILRHLCKGDIPVASAGCSPRPEVHPMAIGVMQESGVDMSSHAPKDIDMALRHIPTPTDVILVCREAREANWRQMYPALETARFHYWPVMNPGDTEATYEEQLRIFRQTRDKLWGRILAWLNECERG